MLGIRASLQHKLHARPVFVYFLSTVVFVNGLNLVLSSLFSHYEYRDFAPHTSLNVIRFGRAWPLLIGMTLIYFALLLYRRKRSAWWLAFVTFGIYGLLALWDVVNSLHAINPAEVANLLVSSVCVWGLVYYRQQYTVKSNLASWPVAGRRIGLVLSVAILYGVIGFQLFDHRDFHREINVWDGVRYTFGQLVTVSPPIRPYTLDALLFLDSLTITSGTAVAYALLSLFGPLAASLSDQSANRRKVERLWRDQATESESFFALWPHDKSYYLAKDGSAALAYRTVNGVALVAGEPLGAAAGRAALIDRFLDFCETNDWLPAFIHVRSALRPLLSRRGFKVQKIGQEAVVEVKHFMEQTATQKYFRQLQNKLVKQGYTCELLQPPHAPSVINALKRISDEWLQLPGRSERGFLLGYFNEAYLQRCDILVCRDDAQQMVAFLNILPTRGRKEASYDLLRHIKNSPTNCNDFIMLSFIKLLHEKGYRSLNLGLSPLAGLDADTETGIVHSTLQLVYAKGDRLYSFKGLERFKAKYEPRWRPRYIAYRGGMPGFGRTMAALNKAMRVKP